MSIRPESVKGDIIFQKCREFNGDYYIVTAYDDGTLVHFGAYGLDSGFKDVLSFSEADIRNVFRFTPELLQSNKQDERFDWICERLDFIIDKNHNRRLVLGGENLVEKEKKSEPQTFPNVKTSAIDPDVKARLEEELNQKDDINLREKLIESEKARQRILNSFNKRRDLEKVRLELYKKKLFAEEEDKENRPEFLAKEVDNAELKKRRELEARKRLETEYSNMVDKFASKRADEKKKLEKKKEDLSREKIEKQKKEKAKEVSIEEEKQLYAELNRKRDVLVQIYRQKLADVELQRQYNIRMREHEKSEKAKERKAEKERLKSEKLHKMKMDALELKRKNEMYAEKEAKREICIRERDEARNSQYVARIMEMREIKKVERQMADVRLEKLKEERQRELRLRKDRLRVEKLKKTALHERRNRMIRECARNKIIAAEKARKKKIDLEILEKKMKQEETKREREMEESGRLTKAQKDKREFEKVRKWRVEESLKKQEKYDRRQEQFREKLKCLKIKCENNAAKHVRRADLNQKREENLYRRNKETSERIIERIRKRYAEDPAFGIPEVIKQESDVDLMLQVRHEREERMRKMNEKWGKTEGLETVFKQNLCDVTLENEEIENEKIENEKIENEEIKK